MEEKKHVIIKTVDGDRVTAVLTAKNGEDAWTADSVKEEMGTGCSAGSVAYTPEGVIFVLAPDGNWAQWKWIIPTA